VASNRIREAIGVQLARLLKEERTKQGRSLNSVADAAGLSRQMIAFVEQGERKPTLDTLLRIADALKVDLIKLLQRAKKVAVNESGH